ncbi:hypothetical protein FQA39_LY17191 [Lamprigera yunnana]|nr:hypothetical protein FQA39_LY17191 [Lamprigera yunnana]
MRMFRKMLKFIDIGANLTDPMYSGIYNDRKKHEEDLEYVLQRSWNKALDKIIITGGNLDESKKALQLALNNEKLFTTVGCHPTRCLEFELNPDYYFNELRRIVMENRNKVVAIGECGLDYDRTQFCPIEIQKKWFERQLLLSQDLNLPLFLHCRNAAQDLKIILSKFSKLKGVVHSFDGTIEEANEFINMGFYIGINGCSLKTKDNLATIVALNKNFILLETDSPWCEIRPTHAGYHLINKENFNITVKKEKWKSDCLVKGRNEPLNIRQVLDIIAGVKKEDPVKLCETIYNNTAELFFGHILNNIYQ